MASASTFCLQSCVGFLWCLSLGFVCVCGAEGVLVSMHLCMCVKISLQGEVIRHAWHNKMVMYVHAGKVLVHMCVSTWRGALIFNRVPNDPSPCWSPWQLQIASFESHPCCFYCLFLLSVAYLCIAKIRTKTHMRSFCNWWAFVGQILLY